MKKNLPLDLQYELALNKSFRYLSFRPRSEKEIHDLLLKKGFVEIVVNQTLVKLKDMKYLDDTEFTKWWIDQRQTYRPKSKYVIKRELQQKGIENSLIDKLLENSTDDLKLAKELMKNKERTIARFKGDEYKKKVSEFLQRRGFSWDIVKEILKSDD